MTVKQNTEPRQAKLIAGEKESGTLMAVAFFVDTLEPVCVAYQEKLGRGIHENKNLLE